MKILMWVVFVCISRCVSHPAKRSPTFIADRLVIVEANEKYVIASGRVSKIDKKHFAISINFTVVQDLDDLSVKVTLFALFSNEYRSAPVEIKKRVCDAWNFELKWVEDGLRKSGHFPDSCHIKKGDYYLKNYVPDTTKFPFVSPWEHVKFRFRVYLTKNNDTVSLTDFYAHVDKN